MIRVARARSTWVEEQLPVSRSSVSNISRRGVSLLLECILGIGIFSIAFLVLIGVFGSIARTNAQSRQYTLAINLSEAFWRQKSTNRMPAS